MNDANNNLRNIDYGIKGIIRFGKIDENDEKNNFESEQLKALETETGASIVKIETLLSTRILLLSNGELYSKGTSFLGRAKDESENDNIPKFIKIKFFDKDMRVTEVTIHNISTGKSHILAIDSEYCVWGWGSNIKCQIDPEAQETSTIVYPHKILRIVWIFITLIYKKFASNIEVFKNFI